MDFKISQKGKLTMHANDVKLDGRWSVVSPKQMEELTGERWDWFYNIQNRRYERTKLHLVFDEIVGRPAIAKTIYYRPEDTLNGEDIVKRRSILTEQITLLNDISSPLLPEPLDWFTVTNTIDGLPEKFRTSEPILILDFQPGMKLRNYISKKKLKFSQPNDKVEEPKVDTPKVGRISLRLLYFLRTLKENGYAYLDLNPDHILLLKDEIPRFVGLGRICRTMNGRLDPQSINFGMTSLGYSAPELNDPTNNWQPSREATAEQVGAFSLGVIIHQMVYENADLDDRMIKKGSFFYPNGISEEKILQEKNGNILDKLIAELCHHDPSKRLTDFNEIETRLGIIAVNIGAIRHNTVKKQHRKLPSKTGWVKYYDSDKNFGFLVDAASLKEYHVSKTTLDKSGISFLSENMRVKFDIVEGDGKPYAVNVERMPQQTNTTRQSEPKREYTPPPRGDEYERKKPPHKSGWCFLSTAAYGTNTAPKLDTLRWFRDEVLRTRNIGRKMLLNYIKVSPKISHLLRGMPIRKAIVRKVIDVSVIAVEKIRASVESSFSYWFWTCVAVMFYYTAFGLAYTLVLPEKLLGIKTTDSNGEDE